MITVRPVASLNDFEFDRLYADSLPILEAGSFPWPEEITDPAGRKSFAVDWVAALLSDQENFRSFVVEIDGLEVMYLTGWLWGDTAYAISALLGPDQNGSRAYYRTSEFKAAWTDHLLAADGISKVGLILAKNSPMLPSHKEVYGLTDEDFTPHGDTDLKAVFLDGN